MHLFSHFFIKKYSLNISKHKFKFDNCFKIITFNSNNFNLKKFRTLI